MARTKENEKKKKSREEKRKKIHGKGGKFFF